ncbi:MAG: helix-turn-helix domain-containing protein [Candidatus Methanomethyliaceae archaeon]|uniref:helix-turn-helix domain-containing protein n=1 Tax=Candidatus Hadarchaeum sp. TaxID=2883567 RepID=UPI003177CABA
MSFGKKLEEWRKRCGLSQEALARKLGMSQGYLNKLEKGKRSPPKREKIIKIAITLAQEQGLGRRGAIEIANDLLSAALYAPFTEEEQRSLKIGLGSKIAELRMRTGKSVEELAQLAKLSEWQWKRIEDEEEIPNLRTLVAMLQAIESFIPLTDEAKKEIYGFAGYGKVEPRAIEEELGSEEEIGLDIGFACEMPALPETSDEEFTKLLKALAFLYNRLPKEYQRLLKLQMMTFLYWLKEVSVNEGNAD